MAALTSNTIRDKRDGEYIRVPVAASTHIYRGAMVALDSNKYLVPAADTAGLVFVGIAEEEADNSSGSNGDLYCLVWRGPFKVNSAATEAQSSMGGTRYAADYQTVNSTTTYSAEVGKVIEVECSSVVWIDPTSTH